MSEPTTSLIDAALVWGGVAVAWLGGEGGRVVVASGLGGLTRWLATERKRLRDGVLAVCGGAVAGQYMWPVVLWVMGMKQDPDAIAMAAFIAGTLGMSFVKVLTAAIEARAAKIGGGDA